MSAAIVDPHSIRCAEVIADVEVGHAVSVNIAEHRGKSPIIKVFLKGLTFFIEKRAAREADRLKATMAVVEEKGVRFAMLHDFASHQSNAPYDIRIRGGPISVEQQHRFAVHAVETQTRAWPVSDRPGPVVGDIEIEVAVAVHIRERE